MVHHDLPKNPNHLCLVSLGIVLFLLCNTVSGFGDDGYRSTWSPAGWQTYYDRTGSSYVDISGGIGAGAWSESWEFDWNWSHDLLDDVSEYGSIDIDVDDGIWGGIGFTHFLSHAIGFDVRVDYMVDTLSSYSRYGINWTWDDGRHYEEAFRFSDDDGELRELAASAGLTLCLAPQSDYVIPFFKFGITAFKADVSTSGILGYAFTEEDGHYQHLDWFYFDAVIDDSINTVGAHVGLDIDFMLSDAMALRLSGLYFYAPPKDAYWEIDPGYYLSEFGDYYVDMDTSDAREMADKFNRTFGPCEIDLSHLNIGLGFSWRI